jgi:hypothetical protein
MIKFVEKNASKTPSTLDDVKVNQFFITMDGCFAQKIEHNSYNLITNSSLIPEACRSIETCNDYLPIKKVLPEIESIIIS